MYNPDINFWIYFISHQQIIAGIYPIAQVREPYSVIGYLAERINLPKLLKLKHPDVDEGDQWTPFDICEGRLFVIESLILKF